MKRICFILLAGLLFSCGSSKDIKKDIIEDKIVDEVDLTDETHLDDLDDHNISITITHFQPWCGGMAPTEEMMERQTQLQRYTSFILLDIISGEKSKVKTDSTGTLYLKIAPGKYAIRELYKDCTFEEFKAENYREPDDYYVVNGQADCYETWWASNLGTFEILAGDEIQHFDWSTRDRCFTGNNPCVSYTGPWPP